ncbi:MAG: NADH-quinone oxidoreductase subunit NuoF [Elusimicrobia bacterium]|nr:NADH-quinone oxidoreductase subunit NuoF [Elusimicrobiota bacterium]
MECLGACDYAPALLVNETLVGAASQESIAASLGQGDIPDFRSRRDPVAQGYETTRILTRHFNEERLAELPVYRSLGGYQGLEKALSLSRIELIEEVKKSNLRGLGGAGFPTGMKWATVPADGKVPGPRYVVANADESEPGCFKDRVLIERSPHQLLEGLLIAAYAIGAKDAFVFIRGEYGIQYRVLRKAVAEAEKAGLVGGNILGKEFSCRVRIMRGAGAYISGLDTALLESMEGKKAWPRQPPPFPTVAGLMGRPTVVNNVETLSMLPAIAFNGGEWFAKIGVPKCGGTAVYSVSGHVERPGVYEFPMGAPLRRILEAAGGVRDGKKLKAVIPGGASTPVLSSHEIDVSMDFEGLRGVGSFLGAGGVIVLDETVNMAEVAHNIERFLAHESCGQCTPCREGSEWTVRILERILAGRGVGGDLPNLQRIGENITGKVICALGDTVGVVTRGFMKKFPKDFERHG